MSSMTITAVEPSAPLVALTLSDRCDQCGAQAYTGWVHPGVTEDPLLLCGHHATEHTPALIGAGWRLVADDRALLLAR